MAAQTGSDPEFTPGPRYQRPPWFLVSVMNPVLRLIVGRLGLGGAGRAVLDVRGRKTGQWRHTPVNVLSLNGQRYLVAPRGETEWARNLRANPDARLAHGRRIEPIRATEVPDAEKPPILRAYVERWGGEVRGLINVPGPGASNQDFRKIAAQHPVFRIEPNQAG